MNAIGAIIALATIASFLWLWHYITRIIPQMRLSIARHRIWKVRDRASLMGIQGRIPQEHARWIVHVSDLVIQNCQYMTLWRFVLEYRLGPISHSHEIQPPSIESLTEEQKKLMIGLLNDLFKQVEALLFTASLSGIIIHKWAIARSILKRMANVSNIGKAALPLACNDSDHHSFQNARHA